MQKFSYLLSCFAFAAILMVGCQVDPNLPLEDIAPKDYCEHQAEVLENDCGLYMKLKDGTKVFARETRNVTLELGMELLIGFADISQDSQGESGGCSTGNCGTSSSYQGESNEPNSLLGCMEANYVKEVRIICIREVEDTTK